MKSRVEINSQNVVFLKMTLISIFLFFVSCDKEHLKDYYITNNYQDSVYIRYKTVSSDTTTQFIRMDESILIFSDSYVMGTVGVEDDRESLAIKYFVAIFNNDTIVFSNNDWIYEELNKYHAKYVINLNLTNMETF